MNKFYDYYLLIHGEYDHGRLQKVTWALFDSKKQAFAAYESRLINSDEEFVEMLKEVYQKAYKIYMDLRSLIIASYQPDLLPRTFPEYAAKLNISLPPRLQHLHRHQGRGQKTHPQSPRRHYRSKVT